MTKKLLKVFCLLLVITFLVTTVLTGCGGKTATPATSGNESTTAATTKAEEPKASSVKIRFAHGWQEGKDAESDMIRGILKKLDDENDSFEIAHEVVVGIELRDKIKVDVAANNTPDMWYFWVGGILADYARNNVLLDMEKYLAKSKVLKKEDIPQGAWDSTTINGKIVGIPVHTSVGVFLCNRELFQKYNLEYPTTWDEFLAVGKEFRKNGITPTNIGSKGGNPSHLWYTDLVCQYEDGLKGVSELSTTLTMNTEPFKKAAKYVEEMRINKMFPDDTIANGDWAPSTAFYNEGKSAMCYTFNWAFKDMSPEIIENSDIIPIPRLPDGERDTRTFIQGKTNNSFVVYAKSFEDPAKQDAIVTILDTLNWDVILKWGQMGGIIPVNVELMKNIDMEQIPNKMLSKALKYRIENKVSSSPMIWQEMPDASIQTVYLAALDELWAGAINADQFITKVQKGFDDWKAKSK